MLIYRVTEVMLNTYHFSIALDCVMWEKEVELEFAPFDRYSLPGEGSSWGLKSRGARHSAAQYPCPTEH